MHDHVARMLAYSLVFTFWHERGSRIVKWFWGALFAMEVVHVIAQILTNAAS